MNSKDFMDQIKAKHGVESDYAVAKLLGLDTSRVSAYKRGRREFDDTMAVKVAGLLEVAPGVVLAEIHAERAKNDSAKHAWQDIAKHFAKKGTAIGVGAMAIIVLSSGASEEAFSIQALAMPLFASPNIHYAHMFVFTVLVAALFAIPIILPLLFNWTQSGRKNENRVTLAGVMCRYRATPVQGGTR